MQEVEEEEESVEERYRKMSKHEKLALLMIALGEDAASTLLKRFDSKDAEGICKRIGDFSRNDQPSSTQSDSTQSDEESLQVNTENCDEADFKT